MRALLIGLFAGYFLSMCAPVLWNGARFLAVLSGLGLCSAGGALCRSTAGRQVWLCGAAACAAASVLAGAVWTDALQRRALLDCADQTIVVRVQVVGLPAGGFPGSRFDARVLDVAPSATECRSLRGSLVRLSWRESDWLVPHQILVGRVRLRRVRGSVSPGAFNAELHALKERIMRSGYLVDVFAAVEPAAGLLEATNRARLQVRLRLLEHELRYPGVLLALLTGDTALLEREHWALLQATGTVHLLVISGLHVGLIGAVLFAAVSVAQRLVCLCLATLRLRWLTAALDHPVAVAGLTALLLGGYVSFTGAGVPALRAFAMAVAMLACWVARRSMSPVALLLIAALAVIVIDPFAGFSAGFWLSFLLVAWLLLGTAPAGSQSARPANRQRLERRVSAVRRVGKLHVGCTLVLLPLLAWLGLPLAALAPIANFVAVPWVTLALLPVLAAAALTSFASAAVAKPLWQLADVLTGYLLAGLGRLASLTPGLELGGLSPLALAGLAVMVLAVLLPVPGCVRALLTAALLARLFFGSLSGDMHDAPLQAPLEHGQFQVQVLDVGQGLAVLVQTRSQTVLYDTGASFPSGFSYARAVVHPALSHAGVTRLDALIVSHADNDHAGGVPYIREHFTPVRIAGWRAGIAQPGACVLQSGGGLNRVEGAAEAALRRWRVDGVAFELLDTERAATENDGSCVLIVRGLKQVAVLPGDIESAAEAELLPLFPEAVDLLIVPHHGSSTSSSAGFVDRLRPQTAIASAGIGNRFGHPREQVVQRYRAQGAQVLVTAHTGSITWRSGRGVVTTGRSSALGVWQPGAPLLVSQSRLTAERPGVESSSAVRE